MQRFLFGTPRAGRRPHLRASYAASTTALLAVAALASFSTRPAHAILNGINVPDNFMPQVGHVLDAGGGRGTGTHLYNDLLRPGNVSFVLTAAHVAGVDFRPGGATGPLIASNAQFNHRDNAPVAGLTEDRDIGLLRFNTPIAGLPTSELFRGVNNRGLIPLAGVNQELVAYDGTVAGLQKRRGSFTIDLASPNEVKARYDQPPPAGAAVVQPGDSGGPFYQGTAASNAISGIAHSTNNVDRSHATILRNVTPGLRYLDWIDSYTQRTVFWDTLRSGGVVLDDFLTVGADGLPTGWTSVQVQHPLLGLSGLSPAWTDIESIGAVGDALFTGAAADDRAFGNWIDQRIVADQLGQGNTNPLLTNVVRKTFTPSSSLLQIDQRWNSLGLTTDIGIQVGNGPITWRGLQNAAAGNLDLWQVQNFVVNPNETITVYLLSSGAAMPEPGSLPLIVALGGTVFGAVARRRRFRA